MRPAIVESYTGAGKYQLLAAPRFATMPEVDSRLDYRCSCGRCHADGKQETCDDWQDRAGAFYSALASFWDDDDLAAGMTVCHRISWRNAPTYIAPCGPGCQHRGRSAGQVQGLRHCRAGDKRTNMRAVFLYNSDGHTEPSVSERRRFLNRQNKDRRGFGNIEVLVILRFSIQPLATKPCRFKNLGYPLAGNQ